MSWYCKKCKKSFALVGDSYISENGVRHCPFCFNVLKLIEKKELWQEE